MLILSTPPAAEAAAASALRAAVRAGLGGIRNPPGPDFPRGREFAVDEGKLAGGADLAARDGGRDVVGQRLGDRGEVDAEFGEVLGDAHGQSFARLR